METSVALFTLVCVVLTAQKKICGAEVEMTVRPGDNVTLYCDCDIPLRSNIAWFRNCSHDQQPALNIATRTAVLPRYRFTWNDTKKTYNLDIINIMPSDLGLYYCARVTDEKHYYGNRSTRLSLNDTTNCAEHTHSPSSSPCSVCWECVHSSVYAVGVVCVLTLVCVCCLCSGLFCRWRTNGSRRREDLLTQNKFQVSCVGEHQCEWSVNGKICYHTEVSYTTLRSTDKSE